MSCLLISYKYKKVRYKMNSAYETFFDARYSTFTI